MPLNNKCANCGCSIITDDKNDTLCETCQEQITDALANSSARTQAPRTPKQPFHETVAVAIRHFGAHSAEACAIAWFLRRTEIPKGHEEIIAAIEERWLNRRFDAKAIIDEVLEQQTKPTTATNDYGTCPYCHTPLVPLDGGEGIYCPEGCLL